MVGTLLGDKFAPGLLDRHLARTGYKAQQSEQPADPNAPINLWSPADGPGGRDFGAHGAFDAKAVDRNAKVWLRNVMAYWRPLVGSARAWSGCGCGADS